MYIESCPKASHLAGVLFSAWLNFSKQIAVLTLALLRYSVCCSVLQRVAVCCSALQCVAVSCSELQCVVACCSVLRCVAVCCIVDSSTYVFFSVNRISEAFQQSCHILGVLRHRHRNRQRHTEADVDTDIETETDTNTDIDVNIDTDIDTDENTWTHAEMHDAIDFHVLPHENGTSRERMTDR